MATVLMQMIAVFFGYAKQRRQSSLRARERYGQAGLGDDTVWAGSAMILVEGGSGDDILIGDGAKPRYLWRQPRKFSNGPRHQILPATGPEIR